MTKIHHIRSILEAVAPPHLQESYDNAGLIVRDPDAEVKGILFCLDSMEAIVDEAVGLGCSLSSHRISRLKAAQRHQIYRAHGDKR